MKSYLQMLEESLRRRGTNLCFGMDPVLERMGGGGEEVSPLGIFRYFDGIMDRIEGRIGAVKPNLGFYLQYGTAGLEALSRLIESAHGRDLPVIVDGKFGDIGRTSDSYARFVFDELGGDAVTLNPYMGRDALDPFLQRSDRGFYIIVLTSNQGARDFQLEKIKPEICLYEYVLSVVCCWNRTCPSTGAVLGATQRVFSHCVEMLGSRDCRLPLLVPGVGTQGGSYGEVMDAIGRAGYPRELVLVNASSSISYAHEKYPGLSVEDAAERAVEDLLSR
jgi:orotidine 5'-phosphate decarboxylase subfamily 2